MDHLFEDKVNDFIKNFKYEELYRQLETNKEYDLLGLLELISYALIYAEMHKIELYVPALHQYLGALRDPDFNTMLTKPQLLYIVYRCYCISKIKPQSPNTYKGLYL